MRSILSAILVIVIAFACLRVKNYQRSRTISLYTVYIVIRVLFGQINE